MASEAMAMALIAFLGAAPAWLARPSIWISSRYPPVAPSGQFLGRPAIPVEGQLRPAQARSWACRAVQADFFLHRPEERQRRVRQFAFAGSSGPC